MNKNFFYCCYNIYFYICANFAFVNPGKFDDVSPLIIVIELNGHQPIDIYGQPPHAMRANRIYYYVFLIFFYIYFFTLPHMTGA